MVIIKKEVCMYKRVLCAAVFALSIPLIFSGTSWAQQVTCKPDCSPEHSMGKDKNKGKSYEDHNRGKGLRRANRVADGHGDRGRDNARMKQDRHRHGGSGVPDPTPAPAPDPVVVPPVEPPPPPSDCIICP
jgi:hypothetical protein